MGKKIVTKVNKTNISNVSSQSDHDNSARERIKAFIKTGKSVNVSGSIGGNFEFKQPRRYKRSNNKINNFASKFQSLGAVSDKLKGWVGDVNSQATHDTGIEAINFSVMPGTKKIAGYVLRQATDKIIDKASSRILSSKLERIRASIKTGKYIKVSGSFVRAPNSKIHIGENFSDKYSKSSSNAKINKDITHDSGYESIQGLRQSSSKVNTGIRTARKAVNTGNTVKAIATGKKVNPQIFNRGKSSFASFSHDIQIDKNSTDVSGVETFKGIRWAGQTSKNTYVGVKNTGIGVKKTYRAGKQIYTKSKASVRNTRNTVKAYRNTKSAVDRANIARVAAVRTTKAVYYTIRSLLNPFALKAAAVFLVFIILFATIQMAVTAVVPVVNSMFGWLYPASDSVPDNVLNKYRQQITEIADKQNEYYSNASNFDIEVAHVNGGVDPALYKDVVAILVVQKIHLGSDNTSAVEAKDFKGFTQKELENMFSKFYTADVQPGTCTTEVVAPSPSILPTPGATNSPGASPTEKAVDTITHTCITVTITNYSAADVMSRLGFSDEEIEIVTAIKSGVDDILRASKGG